MTWRRGFFLLGLVLIALFPALRADEQDRLKVGVRPDGRIVVPTNQILQPAGKQVTFPGRPVDLALIEDGQTLVVKNMRNLVFIDVPTAAVKQTLASPDGFSVVGLLVQGERIYVTDAKDNLHVAERQKDGSYRWAAPIKLIMPKVGGPAHPAGIAAGDKGELWVTLTRGNNVQLIDLASGQPGQRVEVGVAPYMACCPRPGRCYITNWGGDPPKETDPQEKSSGTPVRVDPRTHIADRGSVSVLAPLPGRWKQIKTIAVGQHPSGMVASKTGKFLYVANANSDTVSVIDTGRDEVVETISCRPEGRLPFGSGTNALALSPNGIYLYAANGTNNCLAVIRLGQKAAENAVEGPETSAVRGLIPTGWYPGAVRVSADGKKLFVANVKGLGALNSTRADGSRREKRLAEGLSQPRAVEKGKNSHDHLGSVSIIDVPNAGQLAKYTEQVNANNRLAYSLAGLEKPRPEVEAVPVPARHGEPSLFKHVIYVIKENRTYDQVFGDVKEGNGEPKLCIFGEEVTPNQHKLARQFTLFDNFYCSGVLSADGHSWVNEAYCTDYLEKAFGGFTRSYPYEGSDALAFATSGFLWDNALAHKRTFRNYGEFVKTSIPKTAKWKDFLAEVKAGDRKIKVETKANLQSLAPYTRAGFPSFVMTIPDVYRAQMFLEDLKGYEQKGELPNLIYLYLPCDHTAGTRPSSPTPKAMVADNDLALGRVVEGISQSKFWKDTCIFVVEDDPQNGFDHVDGHRTVALVISPYTKRRFVDSTNYNQTGMVKTIELILGLPPMNQLDLSATPMRGCFQDKPDWTPYAHVPSKVALGQVNPSVKALQGKALHWAKESLKLDLADADQADEDTLNRILWHSVRGEEAYPERYVRYSPRPMAD